MTLHVETTDPTEMGIYTNIEMKQLHPLGQSISTQVRDFFRNLKVKDSPAIRLIITCALEHNIELTVEHPHSPMIFHILKSDRE